MGPASGCARQIDKKPAMEAAKGIQRFPVEEEEQALQPKRLSNNLDYVRGLEKAQWTALAKGVGANAAATRQSANAAEPDSLASILRTIGDGHDLSSARFSGNVTLEAVYDNQQALRDGNSGTPVRLVQEALIALGYELPQFGADGDFGDETKAAVEAFQRDTGLGVDGVVGFHTIEYLDSRDRGVNVAPPAAPVVANFPFNPDNAIAAPGAAPSNALGACGYGLTFPESVEAEVEVIRDGANWRPILTGVIGHYSLQARILPSQTEVTGPGGNTTAANHCDQVTELDALGNCGATALWYMRSAVVAHERVHAEKFRPALVAAVIGPLETAIEAVTVPHSLLINNAAIAEAFLRIQPAFVTALTDAQANWLAEILVRVTGDHAAGGPTDTAEHRIVDPMVRRICTHARASGWPACPAC